MPTSITVVATSTSISPSRKRRMIEIAVEREGERTRDRRRRHQEHVGRLALGAERLALLHAEAVLLVDDGEPESCERRGLLHERVGADDERRRWIGEPRRDVATLLRAQPAGDEHRCETERLEQAADRARVLLGEQLGGRHDGGLEPVIHREEGAEQSDDRLPAADVALEQTLHAPVAAQVGENLAQHARLRAGERERQRLTKLCREQAPVLEPDAAPRLARERLRALLQQLHEEQLLERQSRATLHRFAERSGTVHHAQRVADRRHRGTTQDLLRQIFGDEGEQLVEVRVDDPADHLERETFRRRIDGEHHPLGEGVLVVTEVHEFARLKLAAVEEANVPAHQQRVALGDRAIEERLAGPRHFDHPGVVLQHGLEDPESFSRGQDALGDDAADDRALHSRLERGDGGDGARVLVPMRDVVEQVACRENAETLKRLGARRPNPFQVGDRRLEPEARLPRGVALHSSPSNSCADSPASKTSRSSAASPTPRNLTGTSSASCTATTTPPRAVPSSFVTTRPVMGTAAENIFACCTAFCPIVPSSTSNVSCGALGMRFVMTRATFLSSVISPSLVCKRPAVSMISTSARRATAASIASNATAAGPAPGTAPTNSAPARSAHTRS